MSGWTAKRFWKDARAEHMADGWIVTLDGRVLKTPGKLLLTLPSERLADVVAAEWQAVDGMINPGMMPMTRLANTAVEKVGVMIDAVIEETSRYAATDLICYRADAPSTLVERQAEHWDPLLDWVQRTFDTPLIVTSEIIAVEQPAESLAKLKAEVARLNVFQLTALYDLTALTGSLVIALAASHDHYAEILWRAARLHDDFQAEIWGVDDEAATLAARKKSDFMAALAFLKAV